MHRRGLGGRQAILKQREAAAERKAAGKQLEAATIEHVEEQLALFKTKLAEFARSHKSSINSDPAFRRRFQEMTSKVGVDPLLSSKGFWGKVLGVGDFYFELGVQILDVCVSTRPVNGGVLPMSQCLARLRRARAVSKGPSAPAAAASAAASSSSTKAEAVAVSQTDVERAVEKLGALGSGISVQHARVGGKLEAMIVSVPRDLSADTATIVAAINTAGGSNTSSELMAATSWSLERVRRSLKELLAEGMLWIDTPHAASGESRYWLPGSITME